MRRMYSKRKLTLYTTPAELRQLADRLEKTWITTQLGHPVPSETWEENKLELVFMTAQEKMPDADDLRAAKIRESEIFAKLKTQAPALTEELMRLLSK